MYTLGIESSCDETSVSILKNKQVLSCKTFSSLSLHKKYGGIIPEIASRRHLKVIDVVFAEAFRAAGIQLNEIEAIAVTQGPGLIGSLLIGVSFAKSLAYTLNIPLLGVNHLHAHLFSPFLNKKTIDFPFLGLVVSGGHTQLYMVEDFDQLEVLGRTTDDAAGEALDKVGRLYGLGFPAGPVIDKLYDSKTVDEKLFRRKKNNSLNFSFSGIKTKATYLHRELKNSGRLTEEEKVRILSSFQYGVVEALVRNTAKAVEKYHIQNVVVGGGVSANSLLRTQLCSLAKEKGSKMLISELRFCTDNAAGIAGLGGYLFKKGYKSSLDIMPDVNLV